MSERNPVTPESQEHAGEELRPIEEVAAENTVPPTENPPREQIEEVTARLQNRTPATPAQAPANDNHTPAGGHGGHGGHHESRGMKYAKNAWGILGFFFVHIVWQGIKRWGEMGGGGGGGHSKPKGGGGHGGGGHGGH